MFYRPARRPDGFTLIELLIVVAIIGLLAAMLIPNLIDALQKAKQKKTMSDERIVGTAMMSWLTDASAAAAAGAATTTVDLASYTPIAAGDLSTVLIPGYIQKIPEVDGWKNTYDYYLETISPSKENEMAVRSKGRDKSASGATYTPGAFDPTDYDQDIVWIDGFFARWPQRMS